MTKKNTESRDILGRKKKVFFVTITIAVFSFLCVSLYLGTIVWRAGKAYKKPGRWSGQPYRIDKEYGYVPNPMSHSYFSLINGEKVSVVFGSRSFRVPEQNLIRQNSTTRILFIGDSFTNGYGIPAEKAFPYLTAAALKVEALNASSSGWGLSQIVLRAREDIPRFKPDYVVVQHSYWLASRSQRFYMPTNRGKMSIPYFCESEGSVSIHPPAYETHNIEVPIADYLGNLLSYTWNVGLQLYFYDDYNMLKTRIKTALNILPKPVKDRRKLVDFAYREIEQVCQMYGAKLLVIKLYKNGLDHEPLEEIDCEACIVVDTLEPLASKLPEMTAEAWKRKYQFWRGDPPRHIDDHPNAEAYRVIANTLVDAIQGISGNVEISYSYKSIDDTNID